MVCNNRLISDINGLFSRKAAPHHSTFLRQIHPPQTHHPTTNHLRRSRLPILSVPLSCAFLMIICSQDQQFHRKSWVHSALVGPCYLLMSFRKYLLIFCCADIIHIIKQIFTLLCLSCLQLFIWSNYLHPSVPLWGLLLFIFDAAVVATFCPLIILQNMDTVECIHTIKDS